ncbi:DUF397 domain-containing protein [Actinomadura sp. LD22]|uniref:DUF397 domain-containing protein n=1 Tax=Actinomadura physcomitrii TaxID=2650748 RepID=A0A6I4MBQ7_9ACTN|nr:DUF397 domain-containing protein [Actinomadura physcomitrii]MWA02340.1 DUF397 domain-containing protein [Actinomadura physcomitrii]MWA03088.1 DUF397 domain-containing protein [Actinomadura physcomitrii]
MTDPAPSAPNWRKATASQGSQGCVELAEVLGAIGIRDSKNPEGPKLFVDAEAWRDLAGRARRGELDLP